MNERIEELYKQSQVGPGLGYDMDKFAELIIQECQQLMIDNIENQLTEDGIVLAFREHFGVNK